MERADAHTKQAPAMPGPAEHRRDDHALACTFEAARAVAERRLRLMKELERAYDARDIDMVLETVRRLLGRDTPSAKTP